MSKIELNIPTKLETIKHVIERRGGEVTSEGFNTFIKKQPKGLHPINYVRLDFQKENLVVVTSSVILNQEQTKDFSQRLQVAINVINEIKGLQEVYENIRKSTEKRNQEKENTEKEDIEKLITARVYITLRVSSKFSSWELEQSMEENPFVTVKNASLGKIILEFKPTNIRDLADGNFELDKLKEELKKYPSITVESVSEWEEL